MKTEEEQCMRILTNAVNECKSDWIALSGGLDSSILAHLRKDQKPETMTIITIINIYIICKSEHKRTY